jgi:DNA mismatch repair protein MutL
VIQRPASVVKELVENAVDAGATSIQVIIKDAGRSLIQVVDNGCGMSPTDARLAFERHSTSKISAADDLLTLHTMGFRGEALASIAAIAQVDLRTMRQGDSIGTRLIISGSQVESQMPEACTPGSNMMVKNLFFNVPVRRRYLKKDSVELTAIMHEFERLALVNTNVEFTIVHNDETLRQLLRGSLKQRIGELFGQSLTKQLLPVNTETSLAKISGFVSYPEHARKRNYLQFFMVNGRNMRHPYFHKAIMSCYEQLIKPDEQPNYFINFEVDPQTIDVNIHPQKHEIKFENEQPIWQILAAAVKESLGKFNAVPSIDFDSDLAPEIPMFNPDSEATADWRTVDTSYNPFDPASSGSPLGQMPPFESSIPSFSSNFSSPGPVPSKRFGHESGIKTETANWEKLYEGFAREKAVGINEVRGSLMNGDLDALPAQPSIVESSLIDGDAQTDVSMSTMQLKGRYIVSPSKSGLMVVDQNRAHVRILYEQFLAQSASGLESQKIIFPEVLLLEPSKDVIMHDVVDDLSHMGLDLSFLGDGSWAINGVPANLKNVNPIQLLTGIVDDIASEGADYRDKLNSTIALAMAREAAIKPGQTLGSEEREKILEDLFKLSTPNYTPDGKLVLSIIPLSDITRLFV